MIEGTPVIEDRGRATVLCALDEIPDPGSRGFRVGRREAMFVIRRGDEVFGYINLCPHQGTPLDWKPDTFLTVERDYIICATHGALFEIDSGLCVWGPCMQRSLAPVRIVVKENKIYLDE